MNGTYEMLLDLVLEHKADTTMMSEGVNNDQYDASKVIFRDTKDAIRAAKAMIKSGDVSGANEKLDDAISSLKKFQDDVKNYDDSLGEVICGNLMRTAIVNLKIIAGSILTFGIGSVIVVGKEIIDILDGMYQMYKEDGFSLKMFNASKARLVAISLRLIKQMERMKSEIAKRAD